MEAMTHADTTVKFAPTKAIVAGVGAVVLSFLTTLSTILINDATVGDITQAQWVTILIAVVTSGVAVGGSTFAVTNKPIE